MRGSWLVTSFLLLGACSSSYQSDPGLSPTDGGASTDGSDASTADGGIGSLDASSDTDASLLIEAGGTEDGGVDAGPAVPFASYLVLRVETDAPNGLSAAGIWQDLSPKAQKLSLGGGASVIATTGVAGAKSMVFDATGPFIDVADAPSLRFGATDDFFVVARALVAVPLEAGGGCTFHYLFTKYAGDGATGPHLRVCAPNTGSTLVGSIKLSSPGEASVNTPVSLASTFGVVSVGRTMAGTRVETYAAGASLETTIAATIDTSSTGSALVLGGARLNGTGGTFGGYIGKVNRLYVYHAPPNTFSKADFDTIRAYVSSAAPLP